MFNEKLYKKQWYFENRHRILIQRKEYRLKNIDKLKKYQQIYKQKNKEKIKRWYIENKGYFKNWRKDNIEKINKQRRQNRKEYRILHPLPPPLNRSKEELSLMSSIRNRRYYYKHRKKILKKLYKQIQDKMKNDIGFKLKIRMRFHLYRALKGKRKTGDLENYIGCSLDKLKKYLESKFKQGMSWGNYGRKGWVIDHIYPLSKANLNDKNEFKKVCHYTNLQPLWEKENLSKGNRII